MQQVRCQVRGVFVAINNAATGPVVVLTDHAGRLMPIFVGLWEAVSINNAQNNMVPPGRSRTTCSWISWSVSRFLSITSRSTVPTKECIMSQLVLCSGRPRGMSRLPPERRIAVALRAGAPIFVDEGLLAAAGQEENISGMVDLSTFLAEIKRGAGVS